MCVAAIYSYLYVILYLRRLRYLKPIFIMLNLALDDFEFPPLVLGRVCHSFRDNQNKIATGIEFITKENAGRILTSSLFRNLPDAIFQLNNKKTKELARYLEEKNRNNVE